VDPAEVAGDGVAEDLSRADAMERRFQVPVTVAALLVIPVMILQSTDVPGFWAVVGLAGDWAIWLTFLAEVLVMLYVVEDRKSWLRKNPLDVMIVVLTPPVGPAVLESVRVLRLLRVVRLFKLAPLMRSVFSVRGVEYGSVLAFLTLLAGGQAFSTIENRSLSDGLYWAISTMTTVGYGDVHPKTDAGRLLAAIVMLVGIGFVAIVTGAIAQRFVVSEDTITEGNRETFRLQAVTHDKLDALLDRLETVENELAELRKDGRPPQTG
jgi:voltage-gated potassium channel